MKWTITRIRDGKQTTVEAALWYEAKELASRDLLCSPMDLDAEPQEKLEKDE